MAMVVKNNVAAQMVLGELNKNNATLKKSLEKVSSGEKIKSAKDNASNYAISEKMREQIRSLEQDSQNVQNGSSLLKVAEDGINNIVDELRNLKELAINSANDHNTDKDRATIQKEFEQKMANINDIANSTNYNGIYLLDGRWKPLAGDGAMVTLTGTRQIITGYEPKDTVKTVPKETFEPYDYQTTVTVTNTNFTGYYLETGTTTQPVTKTHTNLIGYSIDSQPYPETITISTPYTSVVGYYTQDSPYTYTTTETITYTSVSGYSLKSYTETVPTPTLYTSYTGYYTQPLTPKAVTEPTSEGQAIVQSTATLSSGKYQYTIPTFMNNRIITISKDFANTGGAGGKPLVITIPEGITDLEFVMEGSSTNLLNVYFDVKSKNANIWLKGLNLNYNVSGLNQSVIEFNKSSNNNLLSLVGTNTIQASSGNNSNQALIDIGGGLTVQGTGSLKVKVNSTRNAPIIGSDASVTSNANLTLINKNITIDTTSTGTINGNSIGAGVGGSIGSVNTVETVPVTYTVLGAPTVSPPPDVATTVNGTAVTLTGYDTDTVNVTTTVSSTIQQAITPYTLAGEQTFIIPAATIVNGTNVTLTGKQVFNDIVSNVVDGTEEVTIYVDKTMKGAQTFTPPLATVISGTNNKVTLKGNNIFNPPVESVITGASDKPVTLTDYDNYSVDEQTVVTGTKDVPVPVTVTVDGVQTFTPPLETVMNGEDVTLTNWNTVNSTVGTTLVPITNTIPVTVTMEGVPTIIPPVPTIVTANNKQVTLDDWDTVTVGVSTSATGLRPVTYYETVPATINVPVFGTETFEYEVLADLLKNPLKIHHGTKANQNIQLYIDDMRTKALGTSELLDEDGHFLNAEDEDRYWALSYDRKKREAWLDTLKAAQNKSLDDIDVKTKDNATVAMRVLDGAINIALFESVRMGAYLQRLEYTGANIITMNENVQAAESTIRDADIAKEMTNYTKANILMQSAQAMLAQANRNASSVLDLLQ